MTVILLFVALTLSFCAGGISTALAQRYALRDPKRAHDFLRGIYNSARPSIRAELAKMAEADIVDVMEKP